MRFQRRQIFQRSRLHELRSDAQLAPVDDARRNFHRSARAGPGFSRRRGRGVGLKLEASVDHLFGVQRFAELQHRGFRQGHSLTQTEALEGFIDVGTLQRQHAARAQRFAYRIRDALADPIELALRRSGAMPKRKDGSGISAGRDSGERQDPQNPPRLHLPSVTIVK